ncbi:uncharacterized protein LOC111993356 isoform X2 [Quercus suber]|uniref:uncharacterized protein LOC111993356 isoform X2 n=1 Tax=Quercus suber TaxID=58331 RepID=UPI0032DEFE7A
MYASEPNTNTKSSKTITLNLLVDNSSNKVVYAEARKEFVDFLFGLLQIPLGSIMGLLWNHGMASGSGSLSKVYESIQNLDPCYVQPNLTKDSLLRPNPAFPSATYTPQLLLNFVPPNQVTSTEAPKTSNCVFGSTSSYFTSPPPPCSPFSRSQDTVRRSPSLFGSGYSQENVVAQHKETGYVRGAVVYMVMDDLMVKPMSTISSISLLNDLNIKDISSLQEKKGLELVRASFDSTTVLTDVFLGNKTYGIPLMDSSPPALMSTSLPQQETPLLLPPFQKTIRIARGKSRRK